MKDAKIPTQKSILEESYIVKNGLAAQATKDQEAPKPCVKVSSVVRRDANIAGECRNGHSSGPIVFLRERTAFFGG
jgi:hypothetical protein